MLMLLLLFFSALLLASLSSFFGYVPSRLFSLCSPCWFRGSLLLPGWFRGDVLRRMGRRRCDWSEWVRLRVLLERTSVQSRPSSLHFRELQAALSPSRQPGSSLGRRDGWRPEREKNHLPTPPVRTAPLRSSRSSPSRGFLARVIWEEKYSSGFLNNAINIDIRISYSYIKYEILYRILIII